MGLTCTEMANVMEDHWVVLSIAISS